MKKNDEFVLDITDLSEEGLGIGRSDGFAFFIKGAVPGDRVRAAATKLNKTYGFGRLLKVLVPSPDRAEPLCPAASRCGGCQLQQLSYEAQLKFKENKVRNNLRRIGGIPLEELEEAGELVSEPILGMDDPRHFRNKASYPFGADREGRTVYGFYAGRTHSIVPDYPCMTGAPENEGVLRIIKDFMDSQGIRPYDERTLKGTVRHVLIRRSDFAKELMVCVVINADDLPKKNLLAERLRAFSENGFTVSDFSLSINKKNTNVIMGDRIVPVYGRGYIEERLTDPADGESLLFRISPLSFFQVNRVQAEKLYSLALSYAGLTGAENVWDLYCGTGSISLFLARKAGKVFGVEVIPDAIRDARANAEANGLSNTEFFVGRAEEVLPAWYEKHRLEGEKIDVIVTDPPRKGCDEACLSTMARMAPERIVYVSCDSATLARDLKYLLANGYALRRLGIVDMFPFSVHVETIVLLQKLNS